VNADWGQLGMTPNACDDPPAPGSLSPPTAEGGSLRSQDVRTLGDPTGLNGALLRLDPNTGAGWPTNPLSASSDLDARRVAAFGFRNPYRFAVRPGTSEVWVGDVGARYYEEVNRVAVSTAPGPGNTLPPNYGWPCYEGPAKQSGFQNANLNLCTSLYNGGGGGTIAPYWGWSKPQVVGTCPKTGGTAVTGVTFYPSAGPYPARYRGGLFVADYSRGCITFLPKRADNGLPDTTKVETFDTSASTPVDLQVGPGGELYYVDVNGGTVRRYVFADGSNHAPDATATVTVDPDRTAHFDASGTTDVDPGDVGTLTYEWDFDDGATAPASQSPTVSHTYATAGLFTATLTVRDTHGGVDTFELLVGPGKAKPVPVITTPSAGTTWSVGEEITFSGTATDEDSPPAELSWALRIQHCYTLDSCHTHYIKEWDDTSSGSFNAPDHEYPSYLELVLTATDADGLSQSVTRRLDPETVTVQIQSDPPGIPVTIGEAASVTPFSRTVIKGSANGVSAPLIYPSGNQLYGYASWSDGGAMSHVLTPNADATYTVTYAKDSVLNLALNQTATADSFCAPSQGPANVVNGTVAGGVDGRWCSSGTSKWLTVDLGQGREIAGIGIDHAGAGGEDPILNTRDYKIQVSTDGLTWRQILAVSGNLDNSTFHLIHEHARYVRMLITKPTGDATTQAHIYEFKVFGLLPKVPVPPRNRNLAAGKAVTADSFCDPNRKPAKVVNVRWVDVWNSWCSNGATPWIRIDLGSVVSIGDVLIRHGGAGSGVSADNTRDFTLQVSTDGATWVTPPDGAVVGNVYDVTRHAVNLSARYVRITITKPAETGTRAQLYEVEVYGPQP